MPDTPDAPFAEDCLALGASGPRLEAYPNRELALGTLTISRALPIKDRRLVGPWCFLDRFGPLTFADGKPMDVAPHPHIGLQTVTWLLDGEVVHDDSLGSSSLLRPGGVNVMTAGAGISHTEQTPPRHSGRLNGVQLWTALPDARRHDTATFAHVGEVPRIETPGGIASIFAGALLGATSPAPYFSDLVGLDVQVHAGHALDLPLRRDFEHALLVLDGDVALNGQSLEPKVLYYLGAGRSDCSVTSRGGGRTLLIGGPPFPERILMWWNFVARTPEELAAARADWEGHRRFGDVPAYAGARLAAPALVRAVRPEPIS
jgi:redox-sensitive bicupin YhaK (pirin superfamily)